jgi:opacity protein-like surface antigen
MIELLASTSLGLLVLAAPAIAAEMVPPPEVYDWTGFYVGGNLGAAINSSTVDQNVNSGDLGDIGKELKDKIQSSQTVFTGGAMEWGVCHIKQPSGEIRRTAQCGTRRKRELFCSTDDCRNTPT